MRILVAGAAGRVGDHMVPRLLERDDAARVLVRGIEGEETFEKHEAEMVTGDLVRPETLTTATQQSK